MSKQIVVDNAMEFVIKRILKSTYSVSLNCLIKEYKRRHDETCETASTIIISAVKELLDKNFLTVVCCKRSGNVKLALTPHAIVSIAHYAGRSCDKNLANLVKKYVSGLPILKPANKLVVIYLEEMVIGDLTSCSHTPRFLASYIKTYVPVYGNEFFPCEDKSWHSSWLTFKDCIADNIP